jgi:hypothetical protein
MTARFAQLFVKSAGKCAVAIGEDLMAPLSLRNFAGQELCWVRPNLFKGFYELRADLECLATLRYSGWAAVGESDGQQWRFKTKGFWKATPVIFAGAEEPANESTPLASINRTLRGGGGYLVFSDERKYTWSCTGILKTIWTMAGTEGPLFSLKKGRVVEILPEASNVPDLPLLVLFSMYLIRLEEKEGQG